MNRRHSSRILIASLALAVTSAAMAAPRVWNRPNNVTGDWFTATNWDPSDAYPQPGEAISITNGSILLSASTEVLESLTISNATLICTNWDTTISATNVTLLNAGRITLPYPFAYGPAIMSNRVSIVATNVLIETGGSIDVDGRGYLVSQGPGKGSQSGSNNNAGGGHGGRGGDEGSGLGGAEYDVTNAPTAPGSGGGRWTSSAYPTTTGCGGGAVRIVADAVTVNGTITARGTTGSQYDGGGAGGAVFITCGTFAGTNGFIRADGGNGGVSYGGGGGGGGRIAVAYSSVVDAPTVTFSALAGPLYAYYPAAMGTLYLPDAALVRQPLSHFQGVRLAIPSFTEWATSSMLASNAVFSFGDTAFRLTVTNDLTVISNSWITFGALALSSYQTLGLASGAVTNPALQVGGSVRLDKSTLSFGGQDQTSRTAIVVGGGMVMTNGAAIALYAGVSNAAADHGAIMVVSGDVAIVSNSWITASAHGSNGGAPVFRFRDLFVGTNAGFSADYLGFATGKGPGKGNSNGSSTINTGGGHGGPGGATATYAGGATNDNPSAPILPGSGGGDYTSDGNTGPGGGVIRIEGSNVTLHGTMTANGRSGGSYDGGGAGGSVYVTCHTLSGSTSALIQVRGGSGGSGYAADTSGGGGRIALVYANTAGPILFRFVADPGSKFTALAGGLGTLSMPDTAAVQPPFSHLQGVRLVIPGFTSYEADSLLISNAMFSFGDGDFRLTVTNNLTILSNSWFAIGGTALSSTQALPAASISPTNPVVEIGGTLVLDRSALTLGGWGQEPQASMSVGGHLQLTNRAGLFVYGGSSNALGRTNGSVLAVQGATFVDSNCWVFPISNPTNGGAPLLALNALKVVSRGGIAADYRGFQSTATTQYGPGAGKVSGDRGGGGGYGGRGGRGENASALGGAEYGETNRPLHAGSAGGLGYTAGQGFGHGGGLIRVEATDVVLDGTLTANGRNSESIYGGGGSGGGIFMMCDSLVGGSTAAMTATGGVGGSVGGGGGGGRIAVAIALNAAQRADLAAGLPISGLAAYSVHGPFLGNVSVTNGTGYSNGVPGSATYLTMNAGTFNLDVRGAPGNYDTPTPHNYGVTIGIAADSILTNSVTTPADTSNGLRRACIGWTLTDDLGGPVSNDTTAEAVFQLTTNMILTWQWTNEWLLTVQGGPNCTVNSNSVSGWYTNALIVSGISASPAGGYEFLEWTGDAPPANRADNPLAVPMTQARTIRPWVASLTGVSKTWNSTGIWEYYGGWVPQDIPGPRDTVTIAGGSVTVTQSHGVVSVTVSNGATMTFTNWTTALTVSNDFTVRTGGTLTLPAPFSYQTEMSNRVWVICRNFNLESGAVINADAKGCFTHTGPGKGGGSGSNHGSGGGHGGKGGDSDTSAGGIAYGTTNAPQEPGSGGGGTYDTAGGHGGGAVWIDASGKVTVDGTISANGQNGAVYNGAGSGGSIFIISDRFVGGASGVMRANGGDRGSGYVQLGGGGGGRIAVWYGKRTEADRNALLAGQPLDGLLTASNHEFYAGTVSVATGTSYAVVSLPQVGSVVFLKAPPPKGTVFLVR